MKYMLDTNICIYAMKNKPATVAQRINEYLPGELCISTITLAELVLGIYKSANKQRNTDALILFLFRVAILPFDSAAAIEFGKICAYLQKRGTPIGERDTLIAAHALSQSLTIVTNNVREFDRVPGLQIENWS